MPATPAVDVPEGWMAPKGHTTAHNLQPMQVCSFTTMASSVRLIASTGQTAKHGAPSH